MSAELKLVEDEAPSLDGLTEYVRNMADVMGLRDWEFDVETGVDAPDSLAEIEVHDQMQFATVSFHPEWHTHTPDKLRWVVAHELVHCHLHELREQFYELSGTVVPQTRELANKQHDRAVEKSTDAVARAWARCLPLPDVEGWP